MAEEPQNLYELALNNNQLSRIGDSIEACDKVNSDNEPKVRLTQIEHDHDSLPTEIIIKGVASSN